jgi:hypothetical protein
MSRERTALVALAVLFGLAAAPALLLRAGTSAVKHPRPAAGRVDIRVVAVPLTCLEAGIPVFAAASPTGQVGFEPSIVHAINAPGLAPRVNAAATLRLPFASWTAGMQRGTDLLSFYAKRMRPVDFWEMTTRLRTAIGVRPRGTVDSPPLLYVNNRGAVLLRPHDDGSLGVVVLCPAESA